MITIEQARALYEGSDSVHDFAHVLRVLRLAEKLARMEGADLEIVRTAALLHDISRSEDEEAGAEAEEETDHALIAAREARRILDGADPAFIDAVAHAIEAHRFRNSIEPQTIEEHFGAVGVARAFAYGALLGQPLWGEVSEGYIPGQSDEAHTPHHEFHFKLKTIKDRLYTESGRQIAEGRHRFMEMFYEQMAAEVRAER